MTKRLTLVGVAAVAVVWGPYVYAELARRPVPAASPDAQPAVVEPTPVVYAARAPEPVQLAAAPAVELAAAPEQAAEEHTEQAPLAADDTLQPTAASGETTLAAATDSRTLDLAAVAAATEQAARTATAQAPAPAPAVPVGAANEPARAVAAAVEPDPTPPVAAAHDDETARAAKEEEPADKQRAEAKPRSSEHEDAPSAESLAPAFRSTFAREARDAQWASSEEPRLAQLLSGAGVPQAAIAEVRCQSTVCRIALNSVDVQAVQQSPLFQVLYQRVRDEFGPMLLDPTNQDGEQHAAFYVLRKGYELERARDSY